MRIKKKRYSSIDGYKLMVVDDDEGLIDSITTFLEHNGYNIRRMLDPLEALQELRTEHYDLLILDYFMTPIKGDDFIAELRKFDNDLYVILLTGHKDLAPPLATIKAFDIQAYCEKSHRLDQLLLLIESGIKSISQMRKLKNYRDGLNSILSVLPEICQLDSQDEILDAILQHVTVMSACEDAFMIVDKDNGEEGYIYKGTGVYNTTPENVTRSMESTAEADLQDMINRAKINKATYYRGKSTVLPMVSVNGHVFGIIYVSGRVEIDNTHLIEMFARQATALIYNARLREQLENAYAALKARCTGVT